MFDFIDPIRNLNKTTGSKEEISDVLWPFTADLSTTLR